MIRTVILAAMSLSIATSALAETPAANPTDVATPEDLVSAGYTTISGRAGEARDWNRFRSLMAPDARFIIKSVAADGAVRRRVLGVEELSASTDTSFATEAFFERGVVAHEMVRAHMAVVVSPYEARDAPGAAPFARGIKHFELTSDGKRWYLESLVWEPETTASPLTPDAAAALKARSR
jgi:hypothetical protein